MSTAMYPHYLLQIFSLSAGVCLLSMTSCFDVVDSLSHHQHPQHNQPSLCRATPTEQHEYAAARYERARPSGSDEALDKFLSEWHRDLREEDTVRYQPVRMIGRGAHGSVAEAKDLGTGKMVAIKQVKNTFGDIQHPRSGHRTLQELVLMRLLNSSDHTISIYHVFLPNDEDKSNFTNAYFAMELMDAKLTTGKREHSLMLKMPAKSQKKMMFDVLSGLADMHQEQCDMTSKDDIGYDDEAGIYHRDMSSQNIMGNIDCSFKIIDLGQAIQEAVNEIGDRRYARRPRTGDHWASHNDIWMTGCTFLELIVGKHTVCDSHSNWPIKARMAESATVVDVLGMPSKNTLSKFSTKAQTFFERLRPRDKHVQAPGLVAKYSSRADKELLGLVQKMLVLDPDSRLSAAELLQEPVFASLRNHSPTSAKDQQRLIANSVSESLEILKGSKDPETNRNRMYLEILNNYEHPGL